MSLPARSRPHSRPSWPWLAGALAVGVAIGLPLDLPGSTQAPASPRASASPSEEVSPVVALPPAAEPIERRYLLLVYNPVLESAGGKTLIEAYGWNDPDALVAKYAAEVTQASGGVALYSPADRVEIDGYPVSEDGFQYTDETFTACLADNTREECHVPGLESGFGYAIDYPAMLRSNGICERFNAGEFDEVWMFGAPFMGFWEANQAGDQAIFTNGPIVTDSECKGRLNIMGFNYERGVAEMLEDLGHRVEGTLSQQLPDNAAAFRFFTQYDLQSPGDAQCGNVHFSPNSTSDYDWGRTDAVTSGCVDWLTYPELTGATETVDCSTWSCDARGYLLWWMSHLPHAAGAGRDGGSANWWSYILDRGDA